MKPRVGDRRAHARFEIFGTLVGTVEVWRRLKVRNISLHGALLEVGEPLRVGIRIRGRLNARGVTEDVEGQVERDRALPNGDPEGLYVAGVGFVNALSARMADRLVQVLGGKPPAVRVGRERRRSWRMPGSAHVVFELSTSASVQLRDVSMGGALLSSTTPLKTAMRGRLRLGLAEQPFAAEIDLRRVEAPAASDPAPAYRVGASFTSMDEGSRRSLASFLAND